VLKVWMIRLSVLCNILVLAVTVLLLTSPSMVVGKILDGMRQARQDFFSAYPVVSKDVVFLGDSITHSGQWDEIFPEVSSRNRGVSGDTTTNILERLDQVTDGQPKAIFLKIGTNDLTHGPSDREDSYSQYREILQRIRSESPATQVFVQSILPRAAQFREEVETFNRHIKTHCAELGMVFIDVYSSFQSEDGSLEDSFTYDELHLNGSGYKQWQSLLKPYVQAL